MKRFLIVLLAWTAGPVPADVIIDIVNEGTTRWLCVEVVNGEDVVISRHTAQSKAEACMLTQQLIHPDRVFRAVGQERLKVIVSPEAQALLVKYTLGINGPDSVVGAILTTAYPNGDAPISGAACANFSCGTKGNNDGEVDEVSTTSVAITATGSSSLFADIAHAYDTFSDTGDGQVKAKLPASYTGHNQSFTTFGLDITEGEGDAAWSAKCWCPVVGSVRWSTGTPSSFTTEIGPAGDCYSEYLGLYYDQSASALVCLRSTDGITYSQVGSTVTRTLTCDTDTCPAGVFGYGGSGLAAFATLTDIDVSSTITLAPEPDPDPTPNPANLIWWGDFNDQNFLNYHINGDPTEVRFHHVPVYGRPIQWGGQHPSHVGNGDLLTLVSSPTRGGDYAAKFIIKNSVNGTEPDDCDPAVDCTRRRSQIQLTDVFWEYYEAIPYRTTRWLSLSLFFPQNFDFGGSGFGPVIWGSKAQGGQQSGWLGLQVEDGSWMITHRFSTTTDTNSEWWKTVNYTATHPNSTSAATLLGDFPNEAASKAALGNLNPGGWTDFIFQFHIDTRPFEQNQGFLNVWMRAGSGSWVHVLNIEPQADVAIGPNWPSTNPERVYDRGIGHNASQFGSNVGLYMHKNRVWNDDQNMEMTIDNYKVGDENATCVNMTHDGSDCTQ